MLRSLSLGLFACAVVACNDAGPPIVETDVAPPSRSHGRAGTPLKELAESIQRMEASNLQPKLLAACEELLAAPGEQWRILDGWAIRSGELNYYCKWSAPDPDRGGKLPAVDTEQPDHALDVVEGIARDLASHGIDFIVVPVPKRAQLYPDRLPGIDSVPDDFAGIDLGYASFVYALAQRGVTVIDLLPTMARARYDRSGTDDERLFHDYDPHWTPRAVELTADKLAEALTLLPWFKPGSVRAGVDFRVDKVQTEWNFGPAAQELAALKQPVQLWLRSLRAMDGSKLEIESRDSPILMLGDSYVAHFAEAASDIASLLYARIGTPIDIISIPQGGARSVWDAVARRRDNLAGKRVVVWVVTASVFANPKLKPVQLFTE